MSAMPKPETFEFYFRCIPSITGNPGCGHRWSMMLPFHPERSEGFLDGEIGGGVNYGIVICPNCGGEVAASAKVGDYAADIVKILDEKADAMPSRPPVSTIASLEQMDAERRAKETK